MSLIANFGFKPTTTPLAIYTDADGSKSDAGVGFAAVLPSRIIRGKLPNTSSIFTAEISAIQEALIVLSNMTLNKNTPIVIYSDSQSALQSLVSYDISNPLILKSRTLIHKLYQKGHKTTLCWTPSHVGVRGNEEADHHAKAASETRIITHPTYYKDYNSLFKKSILDYWQSKWTQIINNDARPDILEKIKPKIESWPSSFLRSRRKEVLLCRVRLGHTRLTHGHRMANEPQKHCILCNIPLTVEHILIECPSYQHQRSRLFGTSTTLNSILGDGHVNENFFEYLDTCKLSDYI